MPKAVLKFQLPEEAAEHALAIKAGAMHSLLWDLDQALRGRIKHGEIANETRTALQAIRDTLHEGIRDNDIPFGD